MTPLMNDASMDPAEFVQDFIQRFAQDVQERSWTGWLRAS